MYFGGVHHTTCFLNHLPVDMKKLTPFIACMLFIILQSNAQESITLRMQYKAQKKYHQSMQQNTSTEITYSGSKEMMDTLEAGGTKNQTVQKVEITSESIIRTGKVNNLGVFPLNMEFIKSTSSSGNPPIADGTILYGHCTATSLPVYDSVNTVGAEKETVKQTADLISKTFAQVPFSEKQMKPGDEYKQEIPVNIPVGAATFDMTIVTVYTLKSIKNNIGYFDILMNYTANATYQGTEMPMKGSGSGTMELDATDGFFRRYQLDSDIELNMNVQDMEIKMKMHSALVTHTTLEK
jgi:hypothetical protein